MYKKIHIVFFRFSFFVSCRHRPGHSLGKNIKLHEMKNEKKYVDFLIHKIWQILKRFSMALRWAQTSDFWRVIPVITPPFFCIGFYSRYTCYILICIIIGAKNGNFSQKNWIIYICINFWICDSIFCFFTVVVTYRIIAETTTTKKKSYSKWHN